MAVLLALCAQRALNLLLLRFRDLQADGRATLVVAHPDFSSMSDSRCTISGTFSTVSVEGEVAAAREVYLARHSDSFWVDFGDFSFLRMDDVVEANFIGGFGRAAKACSLKLVSGASIAAGRAALCRSNTALLCALAKHAPAAAAHPSCDL
jgi:hypothetical protein